MRKINYTKRETSPHLLLLLAEMAMMTACEDLESRDKHTKKFRELLSELTPLTDKTHSLVSFLDYCYDASNMSENEIMEVKIYLILLIETIERLSNPDVVKCLIPLAKAIGQAKLKEKENK